MEGMDAFPGVVPGGGQPGSPRWLWASTCSPSSAAGLLPTSLLPRYIPLCFPNWSWDYRPRKDSFPDAGPKSLEQDLEGLFT